MYTEYVTQTYRSTGTEAAWGTPEDIEEYEEESQKEHDALEYYKEWLPTVFNADK